ncbi:MerR family transcriptional regulator [Paraglaciecola sp. L1A13]|uniref:MerR family transcriptional regulator n=1 Tax=Paraglaciecola sp. L1A13 TaxID=2686359 RepID=UPI00131DD66F|nr:MerR family transcriptional regulator [Paraglaciecola sp. L1A13]|tara:strand:+ start:619 stop:1050 length:432 start_codon:yes stop_codon:yes gene_type:complete
MYVKQLAELMDVTTDTVRYYTRVKLLTPNSSGSNGYHQYSPADQKRLRFILSARQLGFSVKDIQNIINESEQGHCPCPLTRELIAQRLAETEVLFQETLKLRNRMQLALKQWDAKPNGASAEQVCSLIETFVDPNSEEVNYES